jgi:hypothetical protein
MLTACQVLPLLSQIANAVEFYSYLCHYPQTSLSFTEWVLQTEHTVNEKLPNLLLVHLTSLPSMVLSILAKFGFGFDSFGMETFL